jgi:uncharacterized protein
MRKEQVETGHVKKYRKLIEIVEQEYSHDPGHTMDHVMRVFNHARQIATSEPDLEMDVLETAILLHDIARIKEDRDTTGSVDHALLGADDAVPILRELGYPEEKIEKIKHCIQTHRYRCGFEPETMEARILFDADKLDLLGAVGIARMYMFAGEYHQDMYSFTPLGEYIQDNLAGGKPGCRIKKIEKHSPNLEFELKIRNIPDRLYTQKAKEMAGFKIKFMEDFFDQIRKNILE